MQNKYNTFVLQIEIYDENWHKIFSHCLSFSNENWEGCCQFTLYLKQTHTQLFFEENLSKTRDKNFYKY